MPERGSRPKTNKNPTTRKPSEDTNQVAYSGPCARPNDSETAVPQHGKDQCWFGPLAFQRDISALARSSVS